MSEQQAEPKHKNPQRQHSREFKMAAVRRMLAGESSSELARELGVARKLLNDWRARVREGGEENLREKGRPAGGLRASRPQTQNAGAAETARLEAIIGKQQALLDFFQDALQRVERAEAAAGKARSTTPSNTPENGSPTR